MTPADTMRAAVEALERVRCSLHQANERQDILDTLWAGPAETTFDALDYAISLLRPALEEGEPKAADRDWTEDFQHENGNYMCRCVHCSETFFGYKRRVCCKLCAASIPPITPVEAGKVGDAADVKGPDDAQR